MGSYFLLQSGTDCITKWRSWLSINISVITKWGQVLLQSGEGITKWGIITKWCITIAWRSITLGAETFANFDQIREKLYIDLVGSP